MEAYTSVGYSEGGAAQAANKLLRHPDLMLRLEYIQSQHVKSKSTEVLLNRERVIHRLDSISRQAEASKQFGTAARCEELIGKHLGMFVERHDHNLTWDGNMASLSTAQLTVMLVTLPQTAFADDPEGLEAWQRDTAGLLDAPAGVVIEATAETVASAKVEEERK